MTVFVLFMWIFYGVAISTLLFGTLKLVRRLELTFFIGILMVFFSIILQFIANFSMERARLENARIKVKPEGFIQSIPSSFCSLDAD